MVAVKKEKLLKDYIPKNATQQRDFLSKYPEFDGRGLNIVIMDSGVDLSFEGMQQTTTDLPKVLDCFDFTGAGLVDTSVIKEADNNNNIIGLSGRSLKIPSSWKNPSGQWHLGIKSVYEMCSGPALESLIRKRKQTISKHNIILKQDIGKSMKKENKRNYKAMIEYLNKTTDLSKDSLVADCIVWFDGEKWQACIDTSFIGDLENVKVLTNYNDTHEYDIIWETVSYCIKIHDNGNMLDIISAYDDHGTYVAHVAAACFPGEPERNGLAPGAQIISMTVMDSRDDILLCHFALKKAFEKCIELKVDIVNCSFGCATRLFKEQIKEMTEKHGIIITHAVGNKGPVHSTVSRTSFFDQKIFNIGSVKMKTNDAQITYEIPKYSSRGPNSFGNRGVCFSAPGDVTLEMPEYYPKKTSVVKGTSFAAPNVAGSIACLISAFKANSIKYSPSIIKFALSKTAFLPPGGDVLAYGHGIIQINAAFEFIKSSDFTKQYESGNRIVKLLNQEKNGIFLKVRDCEKVADTNYSIEILNKLKRDKIALQLTPGAETFVQFSDLKDDTFTVNLDPTKLKSGTLNYAEIRGLISNPLRNAFYLPITVLEPQKITEKDNCRLHELITVEPQIPYRFFILPPKGSRQCIVKITIMERVGTHLYLYYAIENTDMDNIENENVLQFDRTNKTQKHYMEIKSSRIYEIFLSLPSRMTKSVKFDVEIDFYGIHCKKEKLKVKDSAKIADNNVLTFVNQLQDFTAALSANFWKVSFELFPENVCYEKVKNIYDLDSTEYLKLSYAITISKNTRCWFKMNRRRKYPVLRAQIFTESKKFIYGFNYDESVTISAGKYMIVAYVFYPQCSKNTALPAAKNLPFVTITMELYQPFKLAIHDDTTMNNKSKCIKQRFIELKNGNEHQINLENIPAESLPHPLPETFTVHGSMNFSNRNFLLNVPLKQKVIYQKLQKDVNRNVVKVLENVDQNDYERLWPTLNETIKTTKSNDNERENIIPLKFKENFGSELSNMFSTNEYNYNNEINKITEMFDQTKISHSSKAQEYAIKVCDLFLENVENENILKELTQVKQAVFCEHLGTALLVLNKLSTKHQTNPAFKFIDLAIIELLKHLKWDHLVEAHRHALLDRHRDYYRLL